MEQYAWEQARVVRAVELQARRFWMTDDPQGDVQETQTLTATYEHLRHSTDVDELSAFAHQDLPSRDDLAAFSRVTSLLEAVAGNSSTSVDDRVFLARSMPFPNVLVKLSADPQADVRREVAENKDAKAWLVARLAKDPDDAVHNVALHNPNASWKTRLEGAQDERTDAQTLDFLSQLGVDSEQDAPTILSMMVRRAVALNPSTALQTVERLASDNQADVSSAAKKALQNR
jgi:hypothetical protein